MLLNFELLKCEKNGERSRCEGKRHGYQRELTVDEFRLDGESKDMDAETKDLKCEYKIGKKGNVLDCFHYKFH